MDNKNVKKMILILISTIFFIMSCQTIDEDNGLDSLQLLQEDFQQLRTALENNHPSIYLYDSEETMDALFDKTYNSIQTDFSELQFHRILAPMIARVRCGHTSIFLSPEVLESIGNNGSGFPYGVSVIDGHSYIYQNYSQYTSIPLGTELLSINQRSIPSIIDTMLSSISSDGYNVTLKFDRIKNQFSRLYYYFIDTPDTFEIECVFPGETDPRLITIDAVSASEIGASYTEKNNPDELFTYRIIENSSTALLTISSFIIADFPDYVSFFRTSFQDMIDKNVKDLIIDVRGNGGGDPEFSSELIRYFIDHPITYFAVGIAYPNLFQPIPPHDIHFGGNVYVLIDGGCFSTTGHFCSLMQYHHLVTFIGEETGGSFYCNDNSNLITLRNSQLWANIARTTFETAVEGYTKGRGIMPDHEVKQSLQDQINGSDAVMQYTLNLISGNI